MTIPYISIVIPVHNEEECLMQLYRRLMPAMDSTQKPYEIVFINDGSTDGSEKILDELHASHPNHIRVIHFNTNYGQHLAIMAGFEKVYGEIIVTIDADLQNLPEDIPKLVEKIEEGYDVVGGYRQNRRDIFWRKLFSKLHNKIRKKIMPNFVMKDQGCMLRAYKRYIVDLMISSGESNTFIPALALNYASNPTEIPVGHDARISGQSKYNLYKLIRCNFDLITNFSLVPLQLFTLLGIFISCLSGLLVIYLIMRRLIAGPEVEGVFTLFAIAFFFIGLCLLGLGILGEYIGRIYQEVLRRPRFVIRRIAEKEEIKS
jgi:undecaprenyl-phosphate 4-deoxy-4-formamido-L-arabinose transferase